MRTATARARSNMALVKYWGKRDEELVLPHTGSLSMTLDGLVTETRVSFTGEAVPDRLMLDGEDAREGERVRAALLLDLVRAGRPLGGAIVESRNSFPTAGGLASSASGFAALAAAASWAAGDEPDAKTLSILARRASGSACRSVLGGFVEWSRGERADGLDSVAVQHLEQGAWDVAMAIAVVDTGRKDKSSRDAMKDSVETSPFYGAWVQTTTAALVEAKAALAARDIERLGTIAEQSFLRMHATAMANDVPAIFWKAPTLDLIAAVRELRGAGTGAWATIDAGPHVAAFTRAQDVERVRATLAAVRGVREVIVAKPGAGVERV